MHSLSLQVIVADVCVDPKLEVLFRMFDVFDVAGLIYKVPFGLSARLSGFNEERLDLTQVV